VVLVADELRLFEMLTTDGGLTCEELVERLDLPGRSVEILLTALAALKLVVPNQGHYQLTELARTYLLPSSRFYWVPMLAGAGNGQLLARALGTVLRTEHLGEDDRISRRWERGEMTPAEAESSNRSMHSHSFPSALGLARAVGFKDVQRLLDVAGGSGCYSIALALRNPELRCTVADLTHIAHDARTYIKRYGCESRVNVLGFNMFTDAWPQGYDAIFFSNVFHDWDPRRRADLTALSFAALPPGGRIYLHEMLVDDTADGPLSAAMFSVMMLGTRGKQFTPGQLRQLLEGAGFSDFQVTAAYGYYSLVSATRPR
jgi:acetylserotonin N-methyltransferase